MDRYVIMTCRKLKNKNEYHMHPLVEKSKIMGQNENKIAYSESVEGAEIKIKSFNNILGNVDLCMYQMDDLTFFELQKRLEKYLDKIEKEIVKRTNEELKNGKCPSKMDIMQQIIGNSSLSGPAINEDGEYVVNLTGVEYEE